MTTQTTPKPITDYAATPKQYAARHAPRRRSDFMAEFQAYRHTARHPEVIDTRTYRKATGSTAPARFIRRGIDAAQADRREIEAPRFIRGYSVAAVWTATITDADGDTMSVDDAAGLAQETLTADLEARIAAHPRTVEDCTAFLAENWDDLTRTGADMDQHGHDFFLTREGHGAGYWDRGYEEVGDRLTEQAQGYGSTNLDVWEVFDADDHLVRFDFELN